jgi:hypothetical protein
VFKGGKMPKPKKAAVKTIAEKTGGKPKKSPKKAL